MDITPLRIQGAYVATPRQHLDARGVFLEWFRSDQLQQATGLQFEPVQANHSVSRRGTIRGIHFAAYPPGQAKWVYCVRGAILDVVVDVRTGSPTFGMHDAVELTSDARQAVVIAPGLGHAFCVLSDEADVTYLVSTAYNPDLERAVNPLDPALALPWPAGLDVLVSEKDAAAPTLAHAQGAATLPSWDDCREATGRLR
jgi:dTDP-4-dehydrorhamnose 3,5-epimerase